MMKDILASRAYLKRKWGMFLLLSPVYPYAALSSLNNFLGTDFGGGLFRYDDTRGIGFLMLVGSPIFLYLFCLGVKEFCFRPPPFIRLDDRKLEFLQGGKASYCGERLSSVEIVEDRGQQRLQLCEGSEVVRSIKISDLEISEKELHELIAKFSVEKLPEN